MVQQIANISKDRSHFSLKPAYSQYGPEKYNEKVQGGKSLVHKKVQCWKKPSVRVILKVLLKSPISERKFSAIIEQRN